MLKSKSIIALPIFFTYASSLALAAPTARLLGKISVDKPAFLSLAKLNANEPESLLISSFGPFGGDAVSTVSNIGSHMTGLSHAPVTLISQDTKWPNEASVSPQGVFASPMLLIPGGFLVPGKSTGAIALLNPSTLESKDITKPKGGFWYHRVMWKDMDGDGKLDILTARANKPMFGSPKGELLWLKQPADPLNGEWTENIIAQGPDVYFDAADLNGDGQDEIVVAQFFSKKLSVYWKNGAKYEMRVIDDSIGQVFDVQIADLNNDGTKDLLVTNHEGGGKGLVLAYEVPKDLSKGTFTKHVLLKDIETRQGGFNQASPGSARTFKAKIDDKESKPLILVNGDGSQRAHILTAQSQQSGDWNYTETELVDANCTAGLSAIGDANGDGYTDIFVPAYDNNEIHVFTFAP